MPRRDGIFGVAQAFLTVSQKKAALRCLICLILLPLVDERVNHLAVDFDKCLDRGLIDDFSIQ